MTKRLDMFYNDWPTFYIFSDRFGTNCYDVFPFHYTITIAIELTSCFMSTIHCFIHHLSLDSLCADWSLPQIMNFFTHRMGFVNDWMLVMARVSDNIFRARAWATAWWWPVRGLGVGEVCLTAREILTTQNLMLPDGEIWTTLIIIKVADGIVDSHV